MPLSTSPDEETIIEEEEVLGDEAEDEVVAMYVRTLVTMPPTAPINSVKDADSWDTVSGGAQPETKLEV